MVDESKSPIFGLYILDESGIPLIARQYSDHIAENEAILIGGFFSAIDIFSRSSLQTRLTDIGMENKRFYFKSSHNFVQVILTTSDKPMFIDQNTLALVSLVQERVQLLIETIIDLVDRNLLNVEQIIKNCGTSLDSIVFEAAFEEYEDTDNVNMKRGKTLDYTKIADNTLLKKINHLFD